MSFFRGLTLAAVLLIQHSCCVAGQSRLDEPRQLLRAQEERELGNGRSREKTTFFHVVYDLREDSSVDGHTKLSAVLDDAVNELEPAYNKLMRRFSGDHRIQDVRLVQAELGEDGEFTRRLESGEDSFEASATLEITYTCTFCDNDDGLADQITGGGSRKRRLENTLRKKREYESDEYEVSEDGNGGGHGNGGGNVLPSEDDILEAYSNAVQDLHDPVVIDVVFLEELEIYHHSSGKGKGKGGSKSGKGKGKGGKKRGKKSKSGKGKGKGGKKGKGNGGSDSDSSSGSKSGKGKGKGGSDSGSGKGGSGKGKGKGGSSSDSGKGKGKGGSYSDSGKGKGKGGRSRV